jgi:hypothetical protein
MFINPLVRDYVAEGELVALCDASLTRHLPPAASSKRVLGA